MVRRRELIGIRVFTVLWSRSNRQKGAMFSYFADWEAPGRWGLEVLTRKRRLIFRPMEQLQVMPLGSVKIDSVELERPTR